MKDPWAGVVSPEADGNFVCGVIADADNIAENRVYEVQRGVSSATEDPEGMSVQVHGML